MTAHTHIDDWLDTPSFNESENYARFVIEWLRMPAWKITAYEKWMGEFKLFCTYNGEIYRITGASRMGDVWLSRDYEREYGYDLRVSIDDLSEFKGEL